MELPVAPPAEPVKPVEKVDKPTAIKTFNEVASVFRDDPVNKNYQSRSRRHKPLTDDQKQVVVDMHVLDAGIAKLAGEGKTELPADLAKDTFAEKLDNGQTVELGVPVEGLLDYLKEKRDQAAFEENTTEAERLTGQITVLESASKSFGELHKDTEASPDTVKELTKREAYFTDVDKDAVTGQPLRQEADATGNWLSGESQLLTRRREFRPSILEAASAAPTPVAPVIEAPVPPTTPPVGGIPIGGPTGGTPELPTGTPPGEGTPPVTGLPPAERSPEPGKRGPAMPPFPTAPQPADPGVGVPNPYAEKIPGAPGDGSRSPIPFEARPGTPPMPTPNLTPEISLPNPGDVVRRLDSPATRQLIIPIALATLLSVHGGEAPVPVAPAMPGELLPPTPPAATELVKAPEGQKILVPYEPHIDSSVIGLLQNEAAKAKHPELVTKAKSLGVKDLPPDDPELLAAVAEFQKNPEISNAVYKAAIEDLHANNPGAIDDATGKFKVDHVMARPMSDIIGEVERAKLTPGVN